MDSESEVDEFLDCTPPNITESAQKAYTSLLPKKSVNIYEKKYDIFIQWCKKNKIAKYSENVLLAYFSEELNGLKSSTLWSVFSMLKSTLKVKNSVDISNYHKLIGFLKQKNKDYKPKKSLIFEKAHFVKFISEAPDSKFLITKVSNNTLYY